MTFYSRELKLCQQIKELFLFRPHHTINILATTNVSLRIRAMHALLGIWAVYIYRPAWENSSRC